MSNDVVIKGRHITQHPGPLESQTIAAEWYADVDVIEVHGSRFVKVRVDDSKHPDFWLEVLVPMTLIEGKP